MTEKQKAAIKEVLEFLIGGSIYDTDRALVIIEGILDSRELVVTAANKEIELKELDDNAKNIDNI